MMGHSDSGTVSEPAEPHEFSSRLHSRSQTGKACRRIDADDRGLREPRRTSGAGSSGYTYAGTALVPVALQHPTQPGDPHDDPIDGKWRESPLPNPVHEPGHHGQGNDKGN